ncbi:DNA-binding protein [Acinetobacter bereziniae]|uniref:DNA-binding protein n=1 Tax=Acinetobacter bereziniae TaxID=106648 RepID=UPI0012508E8C|nr:DNA-binding protein [Acinetobacter bereziniae]
MNTSISMIKLIEAMNDQPIAFNKHYVFIGCGINGALMLSQLVYWTARTKNSDGWIYKTHHEWTQETGLTRREQETARHTLKKLGFLTEIKKGVPCKVYFKVERENLYKALIEYSESLNPSQLHKSAKLVAQISQTSCTETPNCMHESAKLVAQISPSITENTTENTTDINLGTSTPKAQKFSAKKFLSENGVSEETAQEFIDLKNKKRKTITERALKIIFNQASEAQLSNERVFQIIVLRGWESFKATWAWHETNSQLEQLENPRAAQSQSNQQESFEDSFVEF